MEKLVEFTTADGHGVLVEVNGVSDGPLTRGLSGGEVIERAQHTFEDALGRVQPAVQSVVDQLVSLTHRPSTVSVEFGIDLHATVGAFVAQSGATANFTVTLTWQDAAGT